MYMWMYATLDYSVCAIRIRKPIRGAQVGDTKLKTADAVLQDCTGFSGTGPEQRSASQFEFIYKESTVS